MTTLMSDVKAPAVGNREIKSVRLFDAPRELVWRVWTEPQHIQQWWGPNGFTNTFETFDFRPGGAWRFMMHGPDGRDYQNESVFVEIAPPERLVFDHVCAPLFRCTVTLEAVGSQTRLTFHQVFEDAAVFESVKPFAVPGHQQNLDRAIAHVQQVIDSRRTLTLTRRFAAPRALVWRLWRDPADLARWWGPQDFTNPVCEVDFRVGGGMRIVMQAPDGQQHPMTAAYREIIDQERLTFSVIATDTAGKPLLEGLTTVTFADDGTGTAMTLVTEATALTPEAMAMIGGMDAGWTQSLERLMALANS